jgi:hypothetical protein
VNYPDAHHPETGIFFNNMGFFIYLSPLLWDFLNYQFLWLAGAQLGHWGNGKCSGSVFNQE